MVSVACLCLRAMILRHNHENACVFTSRNKDVEYFKDAVFVYSVQTLELRS